MIKKVQEKLYIKNKANYYSFAKTKTLNKNKIKKKIFIINWYKG